MEIIATSMETIFVKLGTFNSSILQRLHLFFANNYFVYYDTLENYQGRIEPTRERKLLYHLYNLILVSGLLKYVSLTYYQDDWLKVITGEVFFLYLTHYKRVYAYINFGLVFIIFIKLLMFYYEKNLNFDCNKLVSSSNLLKYHNHSFLIVVNVLYWLGYLVTVLLIYFDAIIITIFTLLAYFNHTYNFNLLILIISAIQVVICIKICFETVISLAILYITVLIFLKWTQDEIIKSIRFNVFWRNKVKLNDSFKVYHQFTRTVNEMSKLINMLIGMIYILTPVMFSQAIVLFNEQAITLVDNLMKLLFIAIIPFTIICIYLVNHLGSSITIVNQSIAKFLYPLFNDKNFNRLSQQSVGLNLNYNFGQLSNIMIHMKIDSFIARLNEEYIGFYCFNLFQFTKLAFFQYLYMFMTAYVLVFDLQHQ